jgi:serine/threonine-protein kinase
MKGVYQRAAAVAALLAVLSADALANAQSAPADRAAARALFDQARTLVRDGKHAEACPKFEESQRLDPGIGTEFNLADCFEQIGRTATAWSMFLDVAGQAKQGGQKDREKIARQRASSLEARLSKLSVVVGAETPDLTVKRDGSPIGKVLWGTAVPVDPGAHTIEASAPGRKKWTTNVQVAPGAGETKVTIPALESEGAVAPIPLPSPSAAPSSAAASSAAPAGTAPSPAVSSIAPVAPSPVESTDHTSKPGSTQRAMGMITGGVGLVGAGVATWLTFAAKGKLDDAKAHCSTNTQCFDQTGVNLRKDAVSQADLATIIGGIGVAALIGGAVLYFTAPSGAPPSSNAQRTTPTLAVGPTGLFLKGVW